MSTVVDVCPACSGRVALDLCNSGPHYGAMKCTRCGRHIKWVAAPAIPVDQLELPPGVPDGVPLPLLVGSAGQTKWAETIRPGMLTKTAMFLPADVVQAMRTITEASWWIANRDRQHTDEIRWPASWKRKGAV